MASQEIAEPFMELERISEMKYGINKEREISTNSILSNGGKPLYLALLKRLQGRVLHSNNMLCNRH